MAEAPGPEPFPNVQVFPRTLLPANHTSSHRHLAYGSQRERANIRTSMSKRNLRPIYRLRADFGGGAEDRVFQFLRVQGLVPRRGGAVLPPPTESDLPTVKPRRLREVLLFVLPLSVAPRRTPHACRARPRPPTEHDRSRVSASPPCAPAPSPHVQFALCPDPRSSHGFPSDGSQSVHQTRPNRASPRVTS